jgi:ribosomal protein S19
MHKDDCRQVGKTSSVANGSQRAPVMISDEAAMRRALCEACVDDELVGVRLGEVDCGVSRSGDMHQRLHSSNTGMTNNPHKSGAL